jgi:hypothetical protein
MCLGSWRVVLVVLLAAARMLLHLRQLEVQGGAGGTQMATADREVCLVSGCEDWWLTGWLAGWLSFHAKACVLVHSDVAKC